MTPAAPTHLFRSDVFLIDPKEDEETNPFCYVNSLAEWVRTKFTELGYEPEPVIAEDCGWRVMLKREPFMLWVACGNERSEFYNKVAPKLKVSFATDGREVTWCCYSGSDTPIWTSFFWKKLFGRASTHDLIGTVDRQLQGILSNELRIQICK